MSERAEQFERLYERTFTAQARAAAEDTEDRFAPGVEGATFFKSDLRALYFAMLSDSAPSEGKPQ